MTGAVVSPPGQLPMRGTAGFARQSWVFAVRSWAGLVRNIGEAIALATVAPAVFLTCFLVTQRKIMQAQGIDYAQYVPPWVLVQVLFFLAINSAVRVAEDGSSGLLNRSRSLPVHALAPAVGRTVVNLLLASLTVAVLSVVAIIFGFRFEGNAAHIVGFYVLAITFALIVFIGFESVGLLIGKADAVSPVLTLPMLIFSLLSSGLAPAERFPTWIEPFVANQPVSQMINALRALSVGSTDSLGSAVGWLGLLGAIALVAAAASMRRYR